MPIRNTAKALFLFLALVLVAALYALVPAGSPPPVTADQIVILKSAHELLLLRNGTAVRTYRVSLGREPQGPKTRAGDHRTRREAPASTGGMPKANFIALCTCPIQTSRICKPPSAKACNREATL